MARRGFGGMTALQAALGAATGIGEALQKRDLLAEEKRQRALLEARQKAQDDAALRREEREAVEAGMISADRLPTLTMPGATPLPDMQPTLRQTIGGKEYAYIPRMAQAEKHRGDVMARSLARAERRGDKQYEQQEEEKTLSRMIDAATDKKTGGRTSKAAAMLKAYNPGAYDAIFPAPRGGGGGGLTAGQRLGVQQDMAEAEAWFNTPEPDANKRRMIATTFNNMRTARPNADARELIFATYQAIKAREASDYREARTGAAERRATGTGRGGGRAPSAPPPGAPGAAAARTPAAPPVRDPLDDAFDARNR